ncbi:MAG: hypothetical protein ACWGSQ_03195 [Longimicrobiales bacterium]
MPRKIDAPAGSLLSLLAILIPLAACDPTGSAGGGGAPDFPVLTGPYLGQTPPGDTPELFAPGIVTTGMYTRDVAMTPDGSELYFGVLLGTVTAIIETHRAADGAWTQPEVAPFSRDSRFFNLEPHISPDGSRLLYLSTRVEGRDPEPEEVRSWANQDIWAVDRMENGWGEPYNLGSPVNTEDSEYFPSTTLDGTLYFTRGLRGGQESYIYRSRLVDGRYQEPERLGPEVNSTPNQFNAFIAPDESYLILCTGSREDTFGGTDYYVTFRNEDDRWSGPVNMGEVVNTPMAGEFSPYVSPDGRYFFFMSTRRFPLEALPDTLTWAYLKGFRQLPETGNAGIYWVDAGFIEALRPEGF